MGGPTRVEIFYVAVVILVVLAGPIGWVVKSHFEAQSYNRLTGADATTWEAMWTELRVTGDAK